MKHIVAGVFVAVLGLSAPAMAQCAFAGAPGVVRVGAGVEDIVIDDQCRTLYAANPATRQIEVFSLSTGTRETPIAVADGVGGIDVTPDGGRLYMAAAGGVQVFDTASRTLIRTIPIPVPGGATFGLSIVRDGRIFVAWGSSVVQIDPGTDAVIERPDVMHVGTLERNADRTVLLGHGRAGLYKYTLASDTFMMKLSPSLYAQTAADGDGDRILIGGRNEVRDSRLRIVGSWPQVGSAEGAAVNAAGTLGYHAVPDGIDVIDLKTFQRRQHLSIGDTLAQRSRGKMTISADGTLLAVVTDNGFSVIPHLSLPDPTPFRVVAISSQGANQSLFRFYNAGETPGSVHITLSDVESGQVLAQWQGPAIAPGAAPQIAVSQIENAAGLTDKPAHYVATIRAAMRGTFAHVVWRPQGTLSSLTSCDDRAAPVLDRLTNVHSSALDQKYPSSIAAVNVGPIPLRATLGVYDAATGAKLGAYESAPIPAGGAQMLPVIDLERGASITPVAAVPHYVVKIESAFTGHLQHMVNNLHTGVVADLTGSCPLPDWQG